MERVSGEKAYASQVTNTAEGLRTAGILAKWPAIGLALFILGSLLYGAMAYNLQTHGPLLQWDAPIDDSLHAIALKSSTLVKDVMIAGAYVGEQVISVIGIILGLYYIYKRFWRELTMVLIGFSGGAGIWEVLSAYFNRPRPVYNPPIYTLIHAGGFPSGHALSSVVCYGLLAYLFVPRVSARVWKLAIIAAAVGIMIFIGYSRLFLGEHYLSDVLAGYGLGMAWSGLSYTLIELIFNRKKK